MECADIRDYFTDDCVDQIVVWEYESACRACLDKLKTADECLRNFLVTYERPSFIPTISRDSIIDPVVRAAYDDASCFLALLLEARMKLYPVLIRMNKHEDESIVFHSYLDMLSSVYEKAKKSRKLSKQTRAVVLNLIDTIGSDYVGLTKVLVTPSVCTTFTREPLSAHVMLQYYVYGPKFMTSLCVYGGSDGYLHSGKAHGLFSGSFEFRTILEDRFRQLVGITGDLLESGI